MVTIYEVFPRNIVLESRESMHIHLYSVRTANWEKQTYLAFKPIRLLENRREETNLKFMWNISIYAYIIVRLHADN